jgi:hypothetical protein
MQMYKDAFVKNIYLRDRFLEYLHDVSSGNVKINTMHSSPAKLVSDYIKDIDSHYCSENLWSNVIEQENPALEAIWYQMLSSARQTRNVSGSVNMLPICDISGSMNKKVCGGSVRRLDISYAITLLVSLSNPSEEYNGAYYTFTHEPKYGVISGNTLKDQIESIYGNNNNSTNFEAVFDDMLIRAVNNAIPQEKMPKYLLVISDMQFDAARGGQITNWTAIEEKYHQYGYERPTIIFYNVATEYTDFPVCEDVPKTALINGYDIKVLECLYDGNIPSPLGLLNKAIEVERYKTLETWW